MKVFRISGRDVMPDGSTLEFPQVGLNESLPHKRKRRAIHAPCARTTGGLNESLPHKRKRPHGEVDGPGG